MQVRLMQEHVYRQQRKKPTAPSTLQRVADVLLERVDDPGRVCRATVGGRPYAAVAVCADTYADVWKPEQTGAWRGWRYELDEHGQPASPIDELGDLAAQAPPESLAERILRRLGDTP